MKNVKHMIGSLLKSRLGKQITSGILALAVAASPFYSTAMVIADACCRRHYSERSSRDR